MDRRERAVSVFTRIAFSLRGAVAPVRAVKWNMAALQAFHLRGIRVA